MPGRAVLPISARPTQNATLSTTTQTRIHTRRRPNRTNAAARLTETEETFFYIMKTDQRDVFLTGNTTPRLSKHTKTSCSAKGKGCLTAT